MFWRPEIGMASRMNNGFLSPTSLTLRSAYLKKWWTCLPPFSLNCLYSSCLSPVETDLSFHLASREKDSLDGPGQTNSSLHSVFIDPIHRLWLANCLHKCLHWTGIRCFELFSLAGQLSAEDLVRERHSLCIGKMMAFSGRDRPVQSCKLE